LSASSSGIWQTARRYAQRKPAPVFRSGEAMKTAPQIPLSLVVSAPHGISNALLPPEIFAAADGELLEIIFIDAGDGYVDQSRPGIRHLHIRAASLYDMVQAGLRAAGKDWVILIEDHARPLANFLETTGQQLQQITTLTSSLAPWRTSPARRPGATPASSTPSSISGRPPGCDRRSPPLSI